MFGAEMIGVVGRVEVALALRHRLHESALLFPVPSCLADQESDAASKATRRSGHEC